MEEGTEGKERGESKEQRGKGRRNDAQRERETEKGGKKRTEIDRDAEKKTKANKGEQR